MTRLLLKLSRSSATSAPPYPDPLTWLPLIVTATSCPPRSMAKPPPPLGPPPSGFRSRTTFQATVELSPTLGAQRGPRLPHSIVRPLCFRRTCCRQMQRCPRKCHRRGHSSFRAHRRRFRNQRPVEDDLVSKDAATVRRYSPVGTIVRDVGQRDGDLSHRTDPAAGGRGAVVGAGAVDVSLVADYLRSVEDCIPPDRDSAATGFVALVECSIGCYARPADVSRSPAEKDSPPWVPKKLRASFPSITVPRMNVLPDTAMPPPQPARSSFT